MSRALNVPRDLASDLLPRTSASGWGWSSALIWLIAATLGALVAWASTSEIDQVARAPGTVIASRRVQVVQAVDGGVLQELAVAEGDRVKAGQVLARFDPVRPRSEFEAADSRRAALLAALARLQAELAQREIVWPAEVRHHAEFRRVQEELHRGRQENLRADLASLGALVKVAQDELRITEQLVRDGDGSQLELLRAQRQVAEAQAKLDSRRNQFVQDSSAELAKVRDELEQSEQTATQRRRQLQNIVVTAPMDGIVKNVRFTTLGAVLRPGDELLTVVPVDDRMILEVKVSPRDIAQIRTGLEAAVKFDAYDYTVFGAVEGRVTLVGADSLRDESVRADTPQATYYRVQVVTESPARTRTGRAIEVIPGMTATVDLRTGQRTLLDFLLKPVNKTLREAFGER